MDDGEQFDVPALGRAIVAEREAVGWSTYRLAQRSGVSDPYLRRIEKGKTQRIGIGVVAQLAQALRLTTDDLLRSAGMPLAVDMQRDVARVYVNLSEIERHAWVNMGRSLQEMRAEYESFQRGSEDVAAEPEISDLRLVPGEPIAAISEPEPPLLDDE